ncbi:MAG: bacillithiol biosynthesis cysteine-adding enzyme BshC, partial [Candidatus Acidiferrales bacterium]
ARELTDAGMDAVPVFWLASEDHDLAEVNHCYWPGEGSELERLELELGEHAAGRSVGSVQLGARVTPLVTRAAELLQGESYEWVEGALRASYAPSETLSSAFGKMMSRLLAGRGLIMLDPLDARVQRLAAPVYARALEERAALASELMARGKELDKAGFHAQVKVTARSTLLFCELDGRRVALRQKGEGLSAVDAPLRVEDARAMLEASPERFSANALLRPVVQDSVLPTAAYIGGPAEIAYLAQSQVIYKRLLGRMPAVLPRAAFTLVDAHTAKLLGRYGLSVREVIAGRQGMRRKMEQASVPRGLAKQFESGEKTLHALLEKLRGPLRKLDGTLEGALDKAERKMLYQFLKLRGRAGRAESFRNGVLDRHERALLDTLHPHRALQERVHGLPPWLARYGPPLLDELERRAKGGAQHQVLFL